jgi:Protein of unknown function (DUF4199)
MIRIICVYGLIAGIIVTTPMLWHWLRLQPGEEPFGSMLVGYLTMIVALTMVFLGVKRHRDRALGGVIRFLPAFGVGLAISTVASVLYVIAWETCLAFGSFDFVAYYSKVMIDAGQAAEAESFRALYARPLVRLGMTFAEIFPVGILISAISAAVLRNSRVLPARASS